MSSRELAVRKATFAAVAALVVAAVLAGGGHARAAGSEPGQAPTGPPVFSALSCHGSSFCLATGQYPDQGTNPGPGLLAEWNGRTWRIIPNPHGRLVLRSVTCAGPSFCLAAISAVQPYTVEWNGRKWRALHPQSPDAYDVTCVSRTFCVTYNSISDATGMVEWNGKNWRAMPQGSGGCGGPDCGYDPDLGCASSTDCWATGSECSDDDCDSTIYFQQTWNGTAWVQAAGGAFPVPNAIACTARAFCLDLAPPMAAITHDWGNSWHQDSANLAAVCSGLGGCIQLPALTCGTTRFCMAFPTKHPAETLDWNGTSWQTSPLALARHRLPYLNLLSCGSAKNCAVLGNRYGQPVAEHWDGTAWQLTELPGA